MAGPVIHDLALDDALVVDLVPVDGAAVAVATVPLALPLELLGPTSAVAADGIRHVDELEDVLLYRTLAR